jgi:hypothetical protein
MHELVKRPLNAAMEEVSEEQLGHIDEKVQHLLLPILVLA